MPIAVNNLPDKMRFYLLNEKGQPIRRAPLRVILDVEYKSERQSISLGLLASNHAGYLAYDLTQKKKDLNSNQSVVFEVRAEVLLTDQPRPIILTPHFSSQICPDLVPLTLSGVLPNTIALEHGLNSIQNPDNDDWLLSPGSFGMDAVPILGENGCELLLPSHSAERIIRFHQLTHGTSESNGEFPARTFSINFSPEPHYGRAPRPEPNWPTQIVCRRGELHHYEMGWMPLNHGLGKVLYSLTLAPCEAVRIAVVDWARSEEAGRTEQTGLTEDLTHSLRRDRTIEEVVNAVLREHQSGDSFMGGTAGVGGYGGGFGGGGMGMPGMPGGGTGGGSGSSGSGGGAGGAGGAGGGGQQAGQNWGVTGSHSIGYAMASSSGNRDVDVETTQNLVDEISQASHLARDLRSTVIVQAGQRELETVQTRIVRNHNHSHALTVLYYEVVRHYLVRCRPDRTQPVIFIKYPVIAFNRDETTYTFLRKNKKILQRNLLDSRIAESFDSLLSVNSSESFDANSARIISLVVNIQTADDSTEHDRLRLILVTANGKPVLKDLDVDSRVVPHYFDPAGNRFVDQLYNDWASNTFFIDMTYSETRRPEGSVAYEGPDTTPPLALRQLGFVWNKDGNDDWKFHGLTAHASIQYRDVNGNEHVEFVKILDTRAIGVETMHIKAHGDWIWDADLSAVSERLSALRERTAKFDAMIDHLDRNRLYYNSLIWLNENPNERAVRFENYQYLGNPLIDKIENRPIDVVGDYVAFPIMDALEQSDSIPPKERIVSIPTRGAFAEAKLSHCNASEIIDDTRFWDWQISPCPDEPTEIEPITMKSRNAALSVTPSTFPASGVAITDPQDAPEPFGMKEVMQLLRTPEIFRDMSGIEQLGSLLEKLVEVAGEVEKARIGATVELANSGRNSEQDSTSNRPSTSAPVSGGSANGQRTPNAQESGDSQPMTAREYSTREQAINRNVDDPQEASEMTTQLTDDFIQGRSRGSEEGTPSGSSRRRTSRRSGSAGIDLPVVLRASYQNTGEPAAGLWELVFVSATGTTTNIALEPEIGTYDGFYRATGLRLQPGEYDIRGRFQRTRLPDSLNRSVPVVLPGEVRINIDVATHLIPSENFINFSKPGVRVTRDMTGIRLDATLNVIEDTVSNTVHISASATSQISASTEVRAGIEAGIEGIGTARGEVGAGIEISTSGTLEAGGSVTYEIRYSRLSSITLNQIST